MGRLGEQRCYPIADEHQRQMSAQTQLAIVRDFGSTIPDRLILRNEAAKAQATSRRILGKVELVLAIKGDRQPHV